MVALVRLSTVLTSGDRLEGPLNDASGEAAVRVLLNRCSPCSSVVSLRCDRDGNAAPTPHWNPFDTLTTTGVSGWPRHTTPADPASSTARLSSLLMMKSTIPSALPVLAPESTLPVGSFTLPRAAIATLC